MEEIFADTALLEKAGLRKPWLWQAAEALRPGLGHYPMTLEAYRQWITP